LGTTDIERKAPGKEPKLEKHDFKQLCLFMCVADQFPSEGAWTYEMWYRE